MRAHSIRTATYAAILLGALTSIGCANVLGIEETTLAQKEGPWSCSGNVEVAAPSSDTISLSVTTLALDGTTPLAGINVEACTVVFGSSCQKSVTETTNADGVAEVEIKVSDSGFDGYVEISGMVPDGDEGDDAAVLPAQTLRWYFSRPRTKDFEINALMPSEAGWQQIVASITGDAPEANRGYLTFETRDCDDAPAADVSVALEPRGGSSLYYFAAPTMAFLSEDVQGATDVSGRGAFFNVKPGSVELTSTPASTGATAARFTPSVQAGTISFVELAPNSF